VPTAAAKTSLRGDERRLSPAYPSSVANKIIERKYVETQSTFFIEGQGGTGVEGTGRESQIRKGGVPMVYSLNPVTGN